MDGTLALALGLVVAVLLIVAAVALWRLKQDLDLAEDSLALSHAENTQLRSQVSELEGALRRARRTDHHAGHGGTGAVSGTVVSPAGTHDRTISPWREEQVSTRLVLNATVGETLIRAAALTHGVRRALSPESRNRIRFEMRRTYKQTRKQRRKEMRAAWREMRAEEDAA